MLSSIKIDPEIFSLYELKSFNGNLNSLNRINIFIGANNSGKSRFLRHLFKEDLLYKSDAFNSNQVNNLIKKIKNEVESLLKDKNKSVHYQVYKNYISKLEDVEYLTNNSKLSDTVKVVRQMVENRANENTISDASGFHPPALLNDLKQIANKHLNEIESLVKHLNEMEFELYKVYIPILRGLRHLQQINNKFDNKINNYLLRNKKDYFPDTDDDQIATGLDLYEKVTDLLLGDSNDRDKIRSFEKFIGETFFNNQDFNLVPKRKDENFHVKIGTSEFPIYDLGDGIQSIILLTYPLYFNLDKKTLFFIEEPETHMHPGLQRILIETFLKPEFKDFQFFITTHSNHFLDLSLEYDSISIYTFNKEDLKPKFVIANVNSKHKQILDLLGIRNSSVFLCNCTIWVEGITDRLYIRRYLEVLQKENKKMFKEDYHYSFIEYGGNNITHWSFLESEDEDFENINIEGICSKVFLIADNDGVNLPSKRKKERKIERSKQLEEKLKENFYSTKCLEIENMLSKKIIKQVILDNEGENENLDFKSFDAKSYAGSYLGDFIESNVNGLRKKYRTEYGTIYDKVKFCKAAINQIKTKEDLSEEAIELGNNIITFINNSQYPNQF